MWVEVYADSVQATMSELSHPLLCCPENDYKQSPCQPWRDGSVRKEER